MRRLTPVLVLIALACGGSDATTGTDDGSIQSPSLAIVSGDSQEVAPQDTLPFDAVVQVLDGGEPVPDQLVDWRVLEDNAGEPFVTTTRTNADGMTGNRVVAGTRAHTHPDLDGYAHMEVRWIDQDSSSIEARVDTTIRYLVVPGEIESLHLIDSTSEPLDLRSGDSVPLLDFDRFPANDTFNNPVPAERLADREASWTYRFPRGNFAEEVVGPTGTGWEAGPVPPLHDRGWHGRDLWTTDTTEVDPTWPPDSLSAPGEVIVESGDLSDVVMIDVMLPVCWDHRPSSDDGFVDFEAVEWSADCTPPEDQIQ